MSRRAQPKNIESTEHDKPHDAWLKRANSAWEISDAYYTTNLEQRIVRNQHLFDSKHPPGSKYHTDAYKYRSKLFRPKIRSAGRKTEAAGVQAFFSTIDCIDVQPQDDSNPQAALAAALAGEALKHRLKNDMFWFQTCIGGLQDAYKTGVVCSFNHWLKKTARYTVDVPQFDEAGNQLLDEKGNPVVKKEEREEVLENRPSVDLFPFDQLRFHPAAKWIDPMNTSPFVIRLMPMYVCDIKAKMSENTPKASRWHKLDDEQIKKAKLTRNTNAAQQARDQGRQDPVDLQTPGVADYDMSIVLHCFMINPDDGRRYEFYTLGTTEKLTEPQLLKKTYPHGKVPITYGCFFLEAHKNVPAAGPELAEGLNKETNNIQNSRLDNIQLVLNKRYIVTRGRQVDLRSLVMNAPASVTLATNAKEDVVPLEFNDITASAYQEQSRIDNDTDELLGSFSQSSIQSNRAMNDTATGMQLMHGTSGQLTDYGLMVYGETWMEPTLRQIISLIQYYEIDKKVMGIAATKAKAKLGDQFAAGMGEADPAAGVKPEMMQGDLQLTVNIGVGASNPVFKAQQFIMAVKQLAEVLVALKGAQINGVQAQEIAKELFGYIGYKDGSRFFKLDEEGQADPNMQALQEELQRLTSIIESKQLENEGKLAIEKLSLQQKTASERKEREHEIALEQSKQRHEVKLKLIEAKAKQQDGARQMEIAREGNKTKEKVAKSKPKPAKKPVTA
jgi:hypothetical protein